MHVNCGYELKIILLRAAESNKFGDHCCSLSGSQPLAQEKIANFRRELLFCISHTSFQIQLKVAEIHNHKTKQNLYASSSNLHLHFQTRAC